MAMCKSIYSQILVVAEYIIMLNPKEKRDYFKTHWTIEFRKNAMETAEEIVSVYTYNHQLSN